ncbi:MAG TPA: trypsin-like peptidase domain-containing protein [Thermoanaerobaculia bacterium]|nr:trypsin-like peptidase domain-containing protein [Thermoanaerobaculia bacterium]
MTPLDRIIDAAKKFDRAGAMAAARDLASAIRAVGAACAPETSRSAVKRLRDARYHDAALLVADAVFESGVDDSRLRVLYAQSLIDSGYLAAAKPLLETIAPGDPAYPEARGSLGRVYKQLYVNGGGDPKLRQHYFDQAFNAYYEHYEATGSAWHGINTVALVQLARRRDLDCPDIPLLARTLLERLRGSADTWDLATAGEAAVATGDYAQAKALYSAFAARPDISAFALGSALRQLQEVWGLTDDEEPGASLLPLLRVATLDRSGGEVELKPGNVKKELVRVQDDHLQATFGDERAVPFGWYRRGLECCFSVCRIEDDYDRPAGTGFVVRGGDFRPDLGDRRCILTNDHVVSEFDPKAIPPEKAYARFHALDGTPRVTIDEVLWRSGRSELDAALLSVVDDQLPDVKTFGFAKGPLDRSTEQKIFVIGHPQGGALSISLYDNILLDCNDTFVHYRSPTLPGSSGSPVFNNDWELVALHHAGHQQTRRLDGSGTYEANEGIQMEKIRATARG